MTNKKMNEVECGLMYGFLEKHCPIVRVKLGKNNQFVRSIIIKGAFIRGNDRTHPLDKKKKDITAIMKDLHTTLTNVFNFPHRETTVVVSRYLEIDS